MLFARSAGRLFAAEASAALPMSALAPLRHAHGRGECLFIGVDRKWSIRGQNDAIDPHPTSLELTRNVHGGARRFVWCRWRCKLERRCCPNLGHIL